MNCSKQKSNALFICSMERESLCSLRDRGKQELSYCSHCCSCFYCTKTLGVSQMFSETTSCTWRTIRDGIKKQTISYQWVSVLITGETDLKVLICKEVMGQKVPSPTPTPANAKIIQTLRQICNAILMATMTHFISGQLLIGTSRQSIYSRTGRQKSKQLAQSSAQNNLDCLPQ